MRLKLKYLPLPLGWSRSVAKVEASPYDRLFWGSDPGVGTKARLREMLVSAGWEGLLLEPVLSGKFEPKARLRDPFATEVSTPDLKPLARLLRQQGLKVTDLIDPTAPLTLLWESLTRTPTWLANKSSARSIVIMTRTRQAAQRVTAALIRDLWTTLGGEPEERMPTFRRYAMLSWQSPEALVRLQEQSAAVDLAVVYGGLDDRENLYITMSYLANMSSLFQGLVVYEGTIEDEAELPEVIKACRRAGIHHLWWMP